MGFWRRAARTTTVAATVFGALALPAVGVLGAPPTTAEVDLGRLAFGAAAEAPPGQASTAAAKGTRWATADPVPLDGAVLVGAILEGVSEEEAESLAFEIRTRDGGRWSDWTPMPIGDDGPDEDTDEHDAQRVTSEPFWVQGADRVQVRRADGKGPRPVVRLTGVTVSGGRGLGYDPQAQVGSSAFAATSRPTIVERSSWDPTGACAPREAPSYASDVRFAIIHHTAGSNTYSPDQADDVVRSICLYHRNTRGWDDIGYNFLIDRYGRIYEGRAGGMTEAVQGAHTKGFNSGSTGISMMGDFRSVDPPSAMVSAMDRLLAWKLDVHHVDPSGTTREIAGNGTHWSAGTLLDLPNVTTHGELNSTSCPGAHVRSRVTGSSPAAPRVLSIGSDRVFGGLPPRIEQPVLGDRPTWDLGFRPSGGWTLDVRDAAGRTVRSTLGSGASTSVTWDLRDSQGREVAPGTYTVRARHGDARPMETTVEVLGPVTRVGGADQRTTALANSGFVFDDPRPAAAGFGQTDDVVITAAGDPVALAAAPVAASHNAPLLLATSSGLDASTRSEIARLGPVTAYLVGDKTQVPTTVEDQLRSLGVTDIQRFAGASLAQTTGRASHHVAERHGSREAVVVLQPGASATAIPDGLSGAGYAATLERPLVFTDRAAVHPATSWVLEQRAWDRVLVVGAGTIEAAAMDEITRAARTKSSATKIVRIDGADASAVSARMATEHRSRTSQPSSDPHHRDVGREVVLVPLSDPLAGIGSLVTADLRGSTVLLADRDDLGRTAASRSWLQQHAAELTHAIAAGGSGLIGDQVVSQTAQILRSAGPHTAAPEIWREPLPPGAVPLTGDWDGDGTDDPGWYADGLFSLRAPDGSENRFRYGWSSGATPVVGDWDGDGVDTVGVWQRGKWYIKNSNEAGYADQDFRYGKIAGGDIPLAGDWDRDGLDEPGIYRSGQFFLKMEASSGVGDVAFRYGSSSGAKPVIGDWNGDGRDTIGVVQAGKWHLRLSNTTGVADIAFRYGNVSSSDLPVTGDWDGTTGDGVGVVRSRDWLLRDELSSGFHTTAWAY